MSYLVFLLTLDPFFFFVLGHKLVPHIQLLSAVNCWLKCMLLDPYNQTDHAECKSRPDSGLSAITELDPGYITGMLLDKILYVAFFNSKLNLS